ncbi:MAG TPA: hypothetical protein VGI39_01045 [Polyangiaceae bacterium]|jgi:hypothetical protein
MGGTASLYWKGRTDETEDGAHAPPGFRSDSRQYADWIAALAGDADALASLDALGLALLARAIKTEDLEDDDVPWATPRALRDAAQKARDLLVAKDPRFESLLDRYGAHRYGEEEPMGVHIVAGERITGTFARGLEGILGLSRKELLEAMQGALRDNRCTRIEPALSAIDPDRPDFVVVREGARFLVHEDAERFPRLSVVEIHRQAPEPVLKMHGMATFVARLVAQYREVTLRTARTIAEEQQAFFEQGPSALRPLRLKGAAASTLVNKTMETPHGRFALSDLVTQEDAGAKVRSARERDRKAMQRDLADVAAMGAWAEKQGVEGVAMEVTF